MGHPRVLILIGSKAAGLNSPSFVANMAAGLPGDADLESQIIADSKCNLVITVCPSFR